MAVAIATRLFWTLLGLAIMALAWKLGVGRLDEPGPGLMSVGLGALIAAIGGVRLVGEIVTRRPSVIEPWTLSGALRVGAVVLLLAIYIALFEKVGFIVTTFVLLAILFGAFAGLRWIWAVVLAAALAFGNYGLFKLLLGTQLPAGLFG